MCVVFFGGEILTANAQGVDAGAIYKLRNQCSSKMLDVTGFNRQKGAQVIQWTENDAQNQMWQISPTDSGYYKLIAQHSQKALDIYGAGTADGANVIQWNYYNQTNQQWKIIDVGNGFSKLEPRHAAGKILSVAEPSSNGSRVQISTDANLCAQHWRLEIVSSDNNFYVATDGNNNNPGTLTQPFKTIQKCASVAAAGKTCYIRGGTYRETVAPVNSGVSGSPIRFEAYPGEIVTVSGADRVNDGWQVYQNQIYRTSVTLPVNGYSDIGFLANQIFADGQMMTEARYPNTGFALLRPTLAGGYVSPVSDPNVKIVNSGIPNIPEGWANATVWANEWYVSRTGTVTGGQDGTLTATMTGNWNRSAYWFYLTNKLGLLDAPSEWFYDGNAGKLYLWATAGGIPTNVEAKKRNFAFDLSDRSFIELKNISIFAATITTNNASRNITIDGLRAKYVSHHVTLPLLPVSEQAPGSDNARLLASHAHDTGIQLRGANHTLKNSIIEYSSGNGVLLKGAGHTVDNCIIRDADYQSTYAAPISANGDNLRITHNTITGAGRDAIAHDWHTAGFSFQNSEIAYNDITRFGGLSSDLGGIYICCYVNLNGTRIHHNSVHNPYGYSYHWEVAGIYTDIGSYNATVDHNVIWNMNVNKPKGLKLTENPGRGGIERAFNNTIIPASSLPPSIELRNNILGNTGSSSPNASNNLFSDVNPLFVDPANGLFTLQSGSPAIDAGMIIPGITDGYSGSAPDIGAFEFGRTPWRAGSTLSQ